MRCIAWCGDERDGIANGRPDEATEFIHFRFHRIFSVSFPFHLSSPCLALHLRSHSFELLWRNVTPKGLLRIAGIADNIISKWNIGSSSLSLEWLVFAIAFESIFTVFFAHSTDNMCQHTQHRITFLSEEYYTSVERSFAFHKTSSLYASTSTSTERRAV